MSGFFPASEVVAYKPQMVIPRCGACGLHLGCQSPKMPVSGQGRMGILVVTEAPGEAEDQKGSHLAGPGGQYLRSVMSSHGVDLDRDCWTVGALSCRPPDSRPPTTKEIDYCRPLVDKAIRELNPRVILVLGGAAIRSVIGPIWRDNPGEVRLWTGWKIPAQRYNAWIVPAQDPSEICRMEKDREGPVFRLWFERHVESALKVDGRPWDEVPNYASQVRVLLDPNQAAVWIREKIAAGGSIAFDYETNMLKPDGQDARIVCCSICWRGRETIAYPWVGEAIVASKEILESDVPKLGANNKFETRWSRRFGIEVANWSWDTMLSAHHLDSREGITSVKFQAFVRFGQEDWSAAIKPYLESPSSITPNRIHQVNLRSLLVYCGVDSLIEFKLAMNQRQEMLNGQ